MSGHVAPVELLLDYASGTLPEGPALAVALHIALAPAARATVNRLNAVGGALLESEAPAALDEGSFENVLTRLDQIAVDPPREVTSARPGFEWAPAPLLPHLRPDVGWRGIFGKFDEIRLRLAGQFHRVSLLRLEAGHSLPEHKHTGYEYTVVLQGGYTDNTGKYDVGDFAVGPGSSRHAPIADPGEPCISLIVVEDPIVLTGSWGRWLNPLVRHGLI